MFSCEDTTPFRGGGFLGASEVLLVFCERMVFHIPVMMIGVSELNHV